MNTKKIVQLIREGHSLARAVHLDAEHRAAERELAKEHRAAVEREPDLETQPEDYNV